MPIIAAHLPPELHYIIPLAERHGSDARVAAFDRRLGRHVKYGETLSMESIEPLQKLYIEIREKNHGALINAWHARNSGNGECPPETTWPVYGLLCLFAQLGDVGIAPFNDGTIRPTEVQKELNWNKLPASLRYLAVPATKYGKYQFEDRIFEFLRSYMTSDERAELQALGERYGQDWDAINSWLDEYPMAQHSESRLVYFTGHLLGLGADAGLL